MRQLVFVRALAGAKGAVQASVHEGLRRERGARRWRRLLACSAAEALALSLLEAQVSSFSRW